MAEGRSKSQWAVASSVMALLANCHRDAKSSSAAQPSDFDPHAKADEQTFKVPLKSLRGLLVPS